MKLVILFTILAQLLGAQQKQPVSSLQEDCGVTFSFTAASSGAQAAGTVAAGSSGTTAVIDNRQSGCLDWLVTFSPNTATAALSLAFQTATDVAGVPTTWSNYPGTLVTGINPNTAATTGGAVTEASGVKYPFLRMNLTSLTGGTVSGKLYGWKRRPTYVTILSGGGCPGTVGTPCVVVGPTAAGSAPTTSPVLVAGQDGAPGNTRVIHTDTVGNQRVVGAAADGAAVVGDPVRVGGKDGSGNTQDILTNVAGNIDPAGLATAQADAASNTPNVPSASGAASFQPVYPYSFNGSTWDRTFGCPNQTGVITLTDATRTVLVAASGATSIRICHLHFSTSGGAEEVTISTGTGAACGTGTAVIDDYLNTTSLAMDFQPTAALRGAASQAVCITQSGAAQTAKVVAIYAQF